MALAAKTVGQEVGYRGLRAVVNNAAVIVQGPLELVPDQGGGLTNTRKLAGETPRQRGPRYFSRQLSGLPGDRGPDPVHRGQDA